MASIAHLVWAKMPVRQSWQQAGTEEEMRAARRRRYRQALCVAMTVILIGAVVLVALGEQFAPLNLLARAPACGALRRLPFQRFRSHSQAFCARL
jgi:hypothetical protein